MPSINATFINQQTQGPLRARPILAEVHVSGAPICAFDADFPGVYVVKVNPHLDPSMWVDAALHALRGGGRAAHPEGFIYSATLEKRRKCGRQAKVLQDIDIAGQASVLFKLCD